jgi:hypothetical protein
MKQLLLKSFLILLPFLGTCQDNLAILKNQVSISYDNTLLNHPLLFSSGFNIRYGRILVQQTRHSITAVGSFGFINTPEIDNRLLFGVGGEYSVHFFKRFSFSVGLQANYILSVLDYDVFEYNSEGAWKNQGKLLHKFSPNSYFSLGGDFLHKQTYRIGAFLEASLMRLNKSYERKFLEGYVPTFSIGLKSNF